MDGAPRLHVGSWYNSHSIKQLVIPLFSIYVHHQCIFVAWDDIQDTGKRIDKALMSLVTKREQKL